MNESTERATSQTIQLKRRMQRGNNVTGERLSLSIGAQSQGAIHAVQFLANK